MFKQYELGIERRGWVQNMPEDVYHHGGGPNECSFHLAMQLMRTPAHARYAIDNPDTTDTDAKLFGRAVHAMLLQPSRFEELVVVRPPEIKKRQGKAWEEFRDAHEGFDIITQDQMDAIDDIYRSVMSHPLARVLLHPGDIVTELSGFFEDPESGVSCRIRIDAWNEAHSMLGDVKTAYKNDLQTLGRNFADYHYPGQQAWYTDGALILGLPVQHFVFIVIESDFPHTVRLVTCKATDVDQARNINRIARERWAGCVEADTWPGWPEEIEVIELPPWAGRMPA